MNLKFLDDSNTRKVTSRLFPPKYNEQQNQYYSFINTWCLGGVAVPVTCTDTTNIGLIMETLCRASYLEVRPALYETTIKSKVARNEENGQILDIIFDSTYIDCNGLFNIPIKKQDIAELILERPMYDLRDSVFRSGASNRKISPHFMWNE